MFNLSKQTKKAQVTSYEKYLRNNNVGPEADDKQSIWEKKLPHRDGADKNTTIEDQFGDKHKVADSDDAQIIEKVLENAKGYVTHRTDKWDLPVTPISATVEVMRQKRLAEDWKPETKPHWSHTFNEKKQQGKLPKWPKSPDQSDAIILNNDPRRFADTEGLPIHQDQRDNDAEHKKSVNIKPLVGNTTTITTASIHKVADAIKAGGSLDFDTAIVAILREAEKEKRELTVVEQKTISELKIARTHTLLQK